MEKDVTAHRKVKFIYSFYYENSALTALQDLRSERGSTNSSKRILHISLSIIARNPRISSPNLTQPFNAQEDTGVPFH